MSYPEYREIEWPLLRLLYEQGGDRHEMRAKDTYEPLADLFRLSQLERTQPRDGPYDDGRPKWNNMVRWARRKLKEQGLLSDQAAYGYWRLSDSAIEMLQKRAN